MTRRLSTERLAEVTARVEAGSTVAAEARRLGLSYWEMRTALLMAGKPTKRPRGSAPRRVRPMNRTETEIIRRHQRRMSVRNIARRVLMSPAGVHRVIRLWRSGAFTTHANEGSTTP